MGRFKYYFVVVGGEEGESHVRELGVRSRESGVESREWETSEVDCFWFLKQLPGYR
jgi:hypothetical protein